MDGPELAADCGVEKENEIDQSRCHRVCTSVVCVVAQTGGSVLTP